MRLLLVAAPSTLTTAIVGKQLGHIKPTVLAPERVVPLGAHINVSKVVGEDCRH